MPPSTASRVSLLAQGARCGWFFVLDRTNGKNLVSKPFSGTGNWAKGVDPKTGQPIPDPDERAKRRWLDDRYARHGRDQLASSEL